VILGLKSGDRDTREVIRREALVLMQRLVDCERSGRHQDGVAVSRRSGHALGGDVAASPAAILDHHRLAKTVSELLADDPADAVGNTAGSEANDERDVSTWIGRYRHRTSEEIINGADCRNKQLPLAQPQ
jgi:hypothetical protein